MRRILCLAFWTASIWDPEGHDGSKRDRDGNRWRICTAGRVVRQAASRKMRLMDLLKEIGLGGKVVFVWRTGSHWRVDVLAG